MAKIKRICEQCNKEFEVIPSRIKRNGGKFCSNKCRYESRKRQKEIICKQCGTKFKVRLSQIKQGKGKFCSTKCMRKWQRGKNNPNWKGGGIKQICKQCSKQFQVGLYRKDNVKFCSSKCRDKWRSENLKGEKAYNWRGGKIKRICEECGIGFEITPALTKQGRGKFCSRKCKTGAQKTQIKQICEQCGKEFKAHLCKMKNGGGKFCSFKCYSEHQRGENNPRWKGGISFEPYCFKFNNEFKEYIRNKFGRLCFLCPRTEAENGQRLSVHHVNYDKDCMCNDNLTCQFVPLCRSCNSKVNNNREMWEKKIKVMMRNKLNGWFI